MAAQRYVSAGRKVVVDVDLEKFFDRVDYEILMDRLRKRIEDRAVVRLIRACLDAGTLINGVVEKSRCGALQGGPLSPLLARAAGRSGSGAASEGRSLCRCLLVGDCCSVSWSSLSSLICDAVEVLVPAHELLDAVLYGSAGCVAGIGLQLSNICVSMFYITRLQRQ